jgi:NAD(P)-dependent dehydrogenase (short-subunit alcohol dehydrogenase family)
MTSRVAIVTGAARSIGLAIADRVAADGAVVVAVDRDGERLREAAQRLGERAVRSSRTSPTERLPTARSPMCSGASAGSTCS